MVMIISGFEKTLESNQMKINTLSERCIQC